MEEKKEFKTSEARREAQKRYYQKNKEREVQRGKYRSAKSYIRNCESLEELEEFKNIIEERLQELKSKG